MQSLQNVHRTNILKNSCLMANILKNLVKRFTESWRVKTPKQKWEIVYYIGGILCETIGVTVFTTLKNDWYAYLSELNSSLYLSTSLYTLWYYCEKREYFRGIQGLCSAGIVFAVNHSYDKF